MAGMSKEGAMGEFINGRDIGYYALNYVMYIVPIRIMQYRYYRTFVWYKTKPKCEMWYDSENCVITLMVFF